MSETASEGTTAQVRAFWPTDYRRFAGIVKAMRKEQGDQAADDVAGRLIAAFAADSPEFSEEKFTRATHEVPGHYGQLARALKIGTHVRCQPWTPAPPEKLARVSALAADLADTLSADPRFSAEVFLGAVTPPAPQSGTAGDGEDSGEDDGEEYDLD